MKQILAMGGGGFSMEPDNQLLDRFLISLSDKERPKVCFIGTASGDSENYRDRFYRAMEQLDCDPSHLSLYKPPELNLREFVLSQDIFYVGGGNTRNLLVLWREWGLDKYLKEAWEAGAVLSGISAGSICWFEQGLTDSVTGKLLPLNCLGLIEGSNCPHYDGEAERRPAYQNAIKEGSMMAGIACDDGVAAYFVDGKLVKFVSSRPKAKAYKLQLVDGEVLELMIEPEFLGD